MEADPALQQRIFEFHPEGTWRRLAAGRPLASKRTMAGILERLALLNQVAGGWTRPQPYALPGKPAIDDVLDAIVGIAAASNGATRVSTAPTNRAGLRMEIRV